MEKIHKIKKHIARFNKENKLLSYLSFVAIGFILLYYFTYYMHSQKSVGQIILDSLFQLSLAIIASLIFFVFQVYIPKYKKNISIRPIILNKFKGLCKLINDLFLEISKIYLKHPKNPDELTEDDISTIAEHIQIKDQTEILVAFENRNLTIEECLNMYFEKIDTKVQELLFVYESYLNDEEKNILLIITESSFRQLFDSSKMRLMAFFDKNNIIIKGTTFNDCLNEYIKFYKDILNLIKNYNI